MSLRLVPDMDFWITKSEQLLSNVRLLHAGGLEIFGHGLPPEQLAAMVDAHTDDVDRTLVRMALAENGQDVMGIIQPLDRDTITVMCCRWAHYHGLWSDMRDRGQAHWMPQKQEDVWRAVLLAMVGDSPEADAAAHQLWPDVFVAPQDARR
jgi:hypothetical protein